MIRLVLLFLLSLAAARVPAAGAPSLLPDPADGPQQLRNRTPHASSGEMPLLTDRGPLYAAATAGDTVPLRIFLESGVSFPLIDSAFVWEHRELFDPIELERPVGFRMAGGASYRARYKIAPGLKIGPTYSTCETYVVNTEGPYQLLYPLNRFSTDPTHKGGGLFYLDMRNGMFRALSEGDLPPETDPAWRRFELMRDSQSGMYILPGKLSLTDAEGNRCSRTTDMIVDLGNANLLALFTFNQQVAECVAEVPAAVTEGEAPDGRKFRVLLPESTRMLGTYDFSGLPIVLLDSPMRLPGEGFLGTGFFAPFEAIIDFAHNRILLREHPASDRVE